tara:strand:- start:46 stop:900 length:855 start_codon:yes stop_codon:yes gene_type:complete
MHKKTRLFKEKFIALRTTEEKIKFLKNSFKNEECYILTAGPSINEIEVEHLRKKLKDKLVISVKQTYNLIPELVDFHIINTDNYQVYDFSDNDPIKIKISLRNNAQKTPKYREDLSLFVDNTKTISKEHSLAGLMDFDNYLLDKTDLRPWGPGIMYELGIYLPVLLGCTKVYILGWDLGSKKVDNIKRYYERKSFLKKTENYLKNNHLNFYNKYFLRFNNHFNNILFYIDNNTVLNKPIVSKNEAVFIQKSTFKMYEWFLSKKIKLFIISSKSMLDKRIPRKII